jgi:hypothetical protein
MIAEIDESKENLLRQGEGASTSVAASQCLWSSSCRHTLFLQPKSVPHVAGYYRCLRIGKVFSNSSESPV